MTTNSRGKEVSPAHTEEKEKTLAYLREMSAFLDERDARPDPTWTEADRDRYIEIWERHHGKLQTKKGDQDG